MKFRKKPVIIEAIVWNGDVHEVKEFLPVDSYIFDNDSLKIIILEGDMTANIGDYIIKGTEGEFYPCKPDIFHACYQEEN